MADSTNNQTQEIAPSVVHFEQLVKNKDYENACMHLLDILTSIDSAFGGYAQIECDYPPQVENLEQDKVAHFCDRMAVAIGELFHADSKWILSDNGLSRFMTFYRWMSLIFASSSYVNADHVLRTYLVKDDKNPNLIQLPNNRDVWRRFCLMYTMESNIPLDLESLWKLDAELCVSLCFAMQSPRFIGTQQAFEKRAAVLKWLPEKLAQMPNLKGLPANISHDVYMHCSYDVDADKHRVKESLNQVIRRHLLELGKSDRDVSAITLKDGKPVMFVVLEHFHSAHSIYRTHSTSMISAKEQFYIIGFGSKAVDQAGQDVFDEFVLLPEKSLVEKIDFIKDYADKLQPALLYMPSIGMDLLPIFLSNLKLAPVQAIALGHPATTHSPFIDYVVVEDDYVGSEDCFSEELIRLPKDALPYVPSALAPKSVEYRMRKSPEVVNIGIASTTMKLNPYFLQACRAILQKSSVPVHFHFALGQSLGITHPYVSRFIRTYLGEHATAHAHSPYDKYLNILHKCDLMINPFPFGNTNGIIDMVTLGLVGVCKTGNEVHEHIDEGLFGRLGLPRDLLVADTVDDYVQKTLYLIENHDERLKLRQHIIDHNGLNTLFSGDSTAMGKAFLQKLADRGLVKKPTKRAPRKAAAKPAAKTTKKTTTKTTDKTVKKTAKKSAVKSKD